MNPSRDQDQILLVVNIVRSETLDIPMLDNVMPVVALATGIGSLESSKGAIPVRLGECSVAPNGKASGSKKVSLDRGPDSLDAAMLG